VKPQRLPAPLLLSPLRLGRRAQNSGCARGALGGSHLLADPSDMMGRRRSTSAHEQSGQQSE
jgi:hypothetical protein